MRGFVAVVAMMAFCGGAGAQQSGWPVGPGHAVLKLWPNRAPGPDTTTGPEKDTSTAASDLIAEKPLVRLGNVSVPTLTVFAAQGKNTGAAVVVFPGGGYSILAIDLEGTEVCDWLTSKGITCVLLKYRVPGNGQQPQSGPYPKSPMALEDAQRTVGLVRFHAAEWHIDPHRIGVLGFSAGGHLVAAISTHFEQRLYTTVDAADKESCRQDFGYWVNLKNLAVD